MLTKTKHLWYSGLKLLLKKKQKQEKPMADTSVKQQIVDRIKETSTILVTVNSNPSVDELSGALGITLLLNKLNKHATAVFSGAVPPAIEFLNPEKTFENTVDSLRDFIIALDKEKADHLRYKVVDDMVKIFITPYKTTISEKDLDFSQGDYNVETVLAIGVQSEEDLDKALESHGRILHDATVASLSLGSTTSLGGLEWVDTKASSYSEMLVSLAQSLKQDKTLLDEQIATAFLTGIVAATDRFSNEKTSPDTMTLAANLMAAGANQQLIATKLEEDDEISNPKSDEGELREGESTKIEATQPSAELPQVDDGNGALSISHVPEGTLEEITKQVAAKNAAEATTTAERQLTEELKAGPATPAITEAELLQSEGIPAPNEPLRGAVTLDKWQAKTDDEAGIPSLGGTLNATTEQAEDDKRKELEDDRNRTILSHGGSGYATSVPAYQAPINSVVGAQDEPEVKDIFSQTHAASATVHVDAIQPPAPVVSGPTLAEIDAQNRATTHAEALGAVHEALNATTDTPAVDMLPPASVDNQSLPQLPPLPDFSTLPPLPGVDPVNLMPSPVSDTLGDLLPPATVPVAPPSPADPGQFKIPGQN
ncbi:hypothetical protein H7Y29_00635 [Microbacteriaceae bacterium]|nr:hypothetical protein [Candidatus Saccharibacteria bacterium]